MGKNVIIDVGTYFQNPQYITLEDNVWIDRYVEILAGVPREPRITHVKSNINFTLEPGNVFIGKQVHVAPNCILSGIGGLYIGNNSGIAANTAIYSFSHHYQNLNDKEDKNQYYFTPQARSDQQAMISGPVFIDDFCGVGANSVILPGTTLKRGSWIGSNSLISGSFPESTIISNPHEIKMKTIDNLVIKV
jgi:acetyltransferase-like isoleucine patch superfamily enzyme